MAEKRDEGRKEGRKEGRAQGRADERRALVQYLQERLHHNVLSTEQLEALSPAEVAGLLQRLQAELDTKLGHGS